MPGYNHSPDCRCGWCVKHGGNRIHRSEMRYSTRLAEAQSLLRAHGVRDRITACFVDPNAKCPVCGAGVYYYQNARGSRVFFDDLGPPWPKHPCTDNRRNNLKNASITADSPIARRRGLSVELVEAAQQTGLYRGRYFYGSGTSEHWTPIEIIDVSRRGRDNIVKAVYLESEDRKPLHFRFANQKVALKRADVIMKRNSEISIFSVEEMTDFLFVITFLDD